MPKRTSLRSIMVAGFFLLAAAGLWGQPAQAGQQGGQEPRNRPPAREGEEPGERAFGSITSVGIDRLELKKLDGNTETVIVDDQTRFREGQREIQLEDLKSGDRVVVRGRTNEQKEFVARLVRRLTSEEVARLETFRDAVFGEIVTVDKNQIKVRNPNRGERTVVVSEETVFMKEGQPAALKDLKVGDRIVAIGKETNGQYVATRIISGQLRVQTRETQERRGRESGPDNH